jgi:hypothetical protein
VWGGERSSDIIGTEGTDHPFGGFGNDTLFGEDGRNILSGGNGADVLYGLNNDDLKGNAGTTRCLAAMAGHPERWSGRGWMHADGGNEYHGSTALIPVRRQR